MAGNAFKKFALFAPLVLLSLGFRIFPSITGWKLDPSTTAGRKVFITLTASGKTISNDLPSSDALSGGGATLTDAQLLTSIINDYNGIQRSNLILALDSDTDFASNNTDKRIYIETGDASGASSGEAQQTIVGSSIVSCKIILTSSAFDSAKTYIALVTHELGHCMGLDHPQDTVWSVMSYFYNSEVYRLAIDDKMGMVHLYPKNNSYRSERPTFGVSCARRN
jgi:hypothetical protein